MDIAQHSEAIIARIIQFEEEQVEKNLDVKDMCLSFSETFKSFYEQFKSNLLELRDTELECITSDDLKLKISKISKFFPGKEMVLLDVIKILVFYKIDEKNSIRFLFNRLEYYRKLPKYDKRKYDVAFEIFITSLFSKEFELYDGELDCCIEDYISPREIKDVSVACLYYNVVKSLYPNDVKSIPENILKVATIIESLGIIDGGGLESFYFHLPKDHIKRVVAMMSDVGLDELGRIISQGLEFTEDYNKLEKLQRQIYRIEKSSVIDNSLEIYLKNNSECTKQLWG